MTSPCVIYGCVHIFCRYSAIISAVGGGGIGAIVADSRLGLSLSKITFWFIYTDISIKKKKKIGALGLNFILNMQYSLCPKRKQK
jgi:hypothetical protein